LIEQRKGRPGESVNKKGCYLVIARVSAKAEMLATWARSRQLDTMLPGYGDTDTDTDTDIDTAIR
jgi:hypothetical protein